MSGTANAATSSRWVLCRKLQELLTSEKAGKTQLEVSEESSIADEPEIDWNTTREACDADSSNSLNTLASTSNNDMSNEVRGRLLSIDGPVYVNRECLWSELHQEGELRLVKQDINSSTNSPTITYIQPLKLKTFPRLKSPQVRRRVHAATATTSTNKDGKRKSAKRKDTLVSIELSEDDRVPDLASKSSTAKLTIDTSSDETNYDLYSSKQKLTPRRDSRRTSVTFGEMPKHVPTGIGRRVKPRYSVAQDTDSPAQNEHFKSSRRKNTKRRQSEPDIIFQKLAAPEIRRRRSSSDTERMVSSNSMEENFITNKQPSKNHSFSSDTSEQTTENRSSNPEASLLTRDILTDFKAMKSESSRPINYPMTEEEREMLELDKLYVDINAEDEDENLYNVSPPEVNTLRLDEVSSNYDQRTRNQRHQLDKTIELLQSTSKGWAAKEKTSKKEKKAKRDKERDNNSDLEDKPSKLERQKTQKNSNSEIRECNGDDSKS